MPNTRFPLAGRVAERVASHFPGAPVDAVEVLIDAGFWASLRREEGFTPTISLAWVRPGEAAHPIVFDRPVSLEPAALAKLSPAVERPGIHLGVAPGADGQPVVWGALGALPAGCFVLEVVAPALLVIKQPGEEEGAKYANVAVIEGDQAKFLTSPAAAPAGAPAIVKTLLGCDDSAHTLVELAVSMRKHRRGGALLVVPAGGEEWLGSIVQPMAYQVARQRAADIETLAGLTAVDGATVMTDRFELLAFGAKIAKRLGAPRVDQVAAFELMEGAEQQVIHPTQLGGTRHLSAAQFVQDQREATALVASQDGRFTVFAWSGALGMVQAYRVESFLL